MPEWLEPFVFAVHVHSEKRKAPSSLGFVRVSNNKSWKPQTRPPPHYTVTADVSSGTQVWSHYYASLPSVRKHNDIAESLRQPLRSVFLIKLCSIILKRSPQMLHQLCFVLQRKFEALTQSSSLSRALISVTKLWQNDSTPSQSTKSWSKADITWMKDAFSRLWCQRASSTFTLRKPQLDSHQIWTTWQWAMALQQNRQQRAATRSLIDAFIDAKPQILTLKLNFCNLKVQRVKLTEAEQWLCVCVCVSLSNQVASTSTSKPS